MDCLYAMEVCGDYIGTALLSNLRKKEFKKVSELNKVYREIEIEENVEKGG